MDKDKIRLQHILDAITEIENYVDDQTKEEFLKDGKTQNAVVHQLEIIGEAAKNVSQKLQLQTPQIPWVRLGDTRNRLIHEYFSVDMDIVWEILEKDLPSLKTQIKKTLLIQ